MTALYAMLSFLLVAIMIFTGNTNLGRLISLNKCDYQYSATMGKSIGKDDYYLFEAGIGFTYSKESNRGINAEILMQTAESNYTDSVNWNAHSLSTFEIAVSADVAREYGLTVGSALYAKHIVDGNLYEYTVAQILPYFPGVELSAANSYSNGAIIMGYDSKYVENVSHTTIFFTDDPITDLTRKFSETPVNIVYRADIITFIKSKLAPYLILLVILGIALTSIFVYTLLRVVICDYKRLIMLGFRKRELNKTFSIYSSLHFGFANLSTAVLSIGLVFLFGFCVETSWFLIGLLLVNLITFISVSSVVKWRVWRA